MEDELLQGQVVVLGGPKTEEGKEISKYNAVRHGILKEVMSDYEKGVYSDLLEDLKAQYKPQGFVEEMLVERVAAWYVRLFRWGKAETEFMKEALNPRFSVPIDQGYTPRLGLSKVDYLVKVYTRYETTIETGFIKQCTNWKGFSGQEGVKIYLLR